MKLAWKTHAPDVRLQKVLSETLGTSPIFAQLLLNRNIKTPEQAQAFLFGGLSDCHDPFLMKDMSRSVSRIKKAVEKKEKILIYGDYDVDGVTSIALLAYIFEELGADYETYIPNRLEEGYGLNIRGVAQAREDGVKLLITVDCGINSVEEVICANNYGIDVIITDHHEVKEDKLPPAYAIIDPHQKDCSYPFNHLAGVGVVYKLARALMKGNEEAVDRHLDLVALGTIADIAPLSGENRILSKIGLKQLQDTEKEGLKALMRAARIDSGSITCRHVGFIIAPRINATGRVGSANTALELLMCKDPEKATEIAKVLDQQNRNRQAIEKDILKQAIERVENELDVEKDKVIVLADEAWHPGVLGIVASRIVEEYYLPTILIALEDDIGRGSGRSIGGFDLFKAMVEVGNHLINFGGHEAACGVRIRKGAVEGFRKSLNEVACRSFPEKEDILPELNIDLNLPVSYIGLKLIDELRMLMPYGSGNSPPVFSTNGMKVRNKPRDIGRNGFKFLAGCGNIVCEAVTFKKGHIDKPREGNIVNLAYTPSINSWEGIDTIQLGIKDLQMVG
ncbi:MAG: single-stranded-DNA-specific exonuclease RecJ [Candidatus Omnitrophota bacterium]